MQRVANAIHGRTRTSLAEAVPRAEFALVYDHLLLFAIGRERMRAFSILVLISGLTLLLATTKTHQRCDAEGSRMKPGRDRRIRWSKS
jgi:hypothetical protein